MSPPAPPHSPLSHDRSHASTPTLGGSMLQQEVLASVPQASLPPQHLAESTKSGMAEGQYPPAADPEKAGTLQAVGAGGGDDIPDGGYGWVVVACVAGQNAVTWGVNTTYGVFSSYFLQHNHFSGGSTFRYAWIGGLGVAVSLCCGPLVNYGSRRFGFRVPYIFGVVCVVLGQCLAGICTTYAGFAVCYGLVFGLGLGCTMVTGQPLIAHWFSRRLAFASGIAAAGSGFGGLLLANTTRLILERPGLGVKWALIINGLISLVILTPTAIFLKGRHKALGARQRTLQLKWLWHPGFFWIWSWGFLCMLAYFIALYSLASFATSGLHLSQTQGAALQSILSASQALGRPMWGILLDRGGRVNMTFLCYVICGVSSLAIWMPARSFGVLIFFAIIQGATGGTVWSAAAPLTARVVGVQDLASALGIFWLTLVIPSLVGQPIAILLLEHAESQGKTGAAAYFPSIGFAGATGLACAGMLLGAKRWLQGDWRIRTKS